MEVLCPCNFVRVASEECSLNEVEDARYKVSLISMSGEEAESFAFRDLAAPEIITVREGFLPLTPSPPVRWRPATVPC